MIAAALLCTLLALHPHQDKETLTESWPSGAPRVEREVARQASGELVNDGAYQSWFENGQEESRGRYADGLRTGKWRNFYEDGRRRSVGKYEQGLRTGKWEAWLPDKSVDETEAGTFSAFRGPVSNGFLARGELRDGTLHGAWTVQWPSGEPFAHGSLVNGVPTGEWSWWWPDGTRLSEGSYRDGRRDGEWRFWHPDGAYDARMGSGQWLLGVRLGELEGAEAETAPPAEAALASPAPGPTPLPEKVQAQVEQLTTGLLELSSTARAQVLAELEVHAPAALPRLLARMLELDLSQGEPGAYARALHDAVLLALVPAPSSVWNASTSAEAVAANRTTLRRWLSLWRLVCADEGFWVSELQLAPGDADFLLAPPIDPRRALDGVAVAARLAGLTARSTARQPEFTFGASGRYDLRFSARSKPEGAKAVPLQDALAWLVAHQLPSGCWSADRFVEQCGQRGAEVCQGQGWAGREVGVTGLALLALLGDGNTTVSGPERSAVLRGVAWLLAQQDAEGGLGQRQNPDFVYRHAIATTALCEAAVFSPDPRLLEGARRAIGFIERIRNPYSGWRYDIPPEGKNDTSVTGWMVTALAAGREAGIESSQGARDGALSLVEELTDVGAGRVGYDAMGTASSRIAGINDHFPRDGTETLTAVGLWVRLLVGQRPAKDPILLKHADLISKALPRFHPEGHGVDHYYWFYGTEVMHQLGAHDPKYWKKWREALLPILVEHQRKEGDAKGSWDPLGPWGIPGGRVYSTAMLALCLEGEYRTRPLSTE